MNKKILVSMATWAILVGTTCPFAAATDIVIMDTSRTFTATTHMKIQYTKSLFRPGIPKNLVSPVNYRDKGYIGYRVEITAAQSPGEGRNSNFRVYFNSSGSGCAYYSSKFMMRKGQPFTAMFDMWTYNGIKFPVKPSDFESGIAMVQWYPYTDPNFADLGKITMRATVWITMTKGWMPKFDATGIENNSRLSSLTPGSVPKNELRICTATKPGYTSLQGRIVSVIRPNQQDRIRASNIFIQRIDQQINTSD